MVCLLRGRCAAPQGEADRVAPFPSGFRNDQKRMVFTGAEGNAGVGQPQTLQAAAQQVQNLVADGRIVEVRRQRTGSRSVPVADQHKGTLPYRGRHIGSRKIRPCNLQCRKCPPCGGLHYIPGELFEQLGRHFDLALVLCMGIAFGTKIKYRFAVLQRLQQITENPSRCFVHRHQQLPLLQQQIQRCLCQACLSGGKNIIAKLGVEFLYPLIAILFSHRPVGCADLHADSKLAVPFQQAQPRTAICPGLPQHRRHFG